MAGDSYFTPSITDEKGCYSKDDSKLVSAMNDEISENADDLRQTLNGKPPRHLSVVRHSISTTILVSPSDFNVRPWSLLEKGAGGNIFLSMESALGMSGVKSPSDIKMNFIPVFRSGSCSEKGPKQYMEDEHICIDNLPQHLGDIGGSISAGAFYGVFDGHGGTDAASFIKNNILKFIVEDSFFPVSLEKAIKNAFLKADYALADDSSLDISSGTTVLTAFISERTLVIANAGDCRAVLGKRGKAIEMSKDHKPNYTSERLRIEKLGGVIYDGYLNGQLSVSRALGDWHMKGSKGSACPLSAKPELQAALLTEDDEFLIMGCDGLWDVMSSQCAVTMVRKELMLHNDPERSSRELVREALKRNTCDNLTVIVICFSHDPPPRIEIPPGRVRRSISAEGLNLLKGVLEGN